MNACEYDKWEKINRACAQPCVCAQSQPFFPIFIDNSQSIYSIDIIQTSKSLQLEHFVYHEQLIKYVCTLCLFEACVDDLFLLFLFLSFFCFIQQQKISVQGTKDTDNTRPDDGLSNCSFFRFSFCLDYEYVHFCTGFRMVRSY